MEEAKVLTVSGLAAFLAEIEQLKGLDITVSEEANSISISIGDDTYQIESPEESVVEVGGDVVESVDEINEECWDEIADEVVEDDEPVEGGIIKELIKTLAIGGLVRLTKNALQNA